MTDIARLSANIPSNPSEADVGMSTGVRLPIGAQTGLMKLTLHLGSLYEP